jgi:hypothetical protein
MKRLALVLLIGAALFPTRAHAQLIMTMSNGWSLSFSGNVNAFWVITKEDSNGTGGSKAMNSSIRTGLLPGFANFEARGKEGGQNLAVHFGFAPQINNAGTHDQFGAQIDMREVYLTVGGAWGQILAGRELALFGRQNILNDQTLFGVGSVGIGGGQGGGTTLGRIGYGYIYPNFNAQFTYTTKAGQPAQLSVGLFQPSTITGSNYQFTPTPRLEAEVTFNHRNGGTKLAFWGGGVAQMESNAGSNGNSLSSFGATLGLRADLSNLSVVASAYTGKGLGTLLMFSAVGGGPVAANDSTARPSDGGYLQVGYLFNKKTTVAGSVGLSRLKNASSGETILSGGNGALRTQNTSYTAGIYHQWTKSVKLSAEITKEHQQGIATPSAGQLDVSAGILLFF